MKLNIQSVGFKATKELETFVDNKIQKLIKRNGRLVGVDAILRVEKAGTIENKVVEIILKVPGNDLFAKKNANTFEEAVTLSVEALRRQQRKQLDKLRGK